MTCLYQVDAGLQLESLDQSHIGNLAHLRQMQ